MVREQKQIFTITNTQYTKHIRYFTCSTAVVPSHLTQRLEYTEYSKWLRPTFGMGSIGVYTTILDIHED